MVVVRTGLANLAEEWSDELPNGVPSADDVHTRKEKPKTTEHANHSP